MSSENSHDERSAASRQGFDPISRALCSSRESVHQEARIPLDALMDERDCYRKALEQIIDIQNSGRSYAAEWVEIADVARAALESNRGM